MNICYPVTTEESTVPIMGMSGDFEQNLRWLRSCGFNGVELMLRDPRKLTAKRLGKQLANCGLKAAAIGVTPMVKQDKVMLASPNASIRAEALQRAYLCIELASELEAPFCIGSFRGSVDQGGSDNDRAAAKNAFAQICDYAKRCGVSVLFEPQGKANGNYLNSIPEGVEWIKNLGCDNLKMILDVFHMNITSPDLLAGIDTSEGLYGLVHLCDSDRRLMGFGYFDLESFLKRIFDDGYTGFISTEIKQAPDMRTAARMTADYFNYFEKVVI